jgi:hypothetical protein
MSEALTGTRVREVTGYGPRDLDDSILRSPQPLVLRGLAASWPAVRDSLASAEAADAVIRRHYTGATVGAMLGAPDIGGRFFYNDDLTGFNFQQVRARLDLVLDELAAQRAKPEQGAVYVGSTSIDTCLPGYRAENDLDLKGRDALASIWIGNRTRIAAHYDVPDNLACVVAGNRRFTLFPPEQLNNLYVGPLDLTPAGQAISLVDFHKPDPQRFPRFAEAVRHAQVAELEPGDALFIPSMWWHHVEALASFNVLVNYWWRQVPDYMDTPTATLAHAIMTIRDLPPNERKAWQELFRHYVFEADGDTAAHIPPHARMSLAPIDEKASRILRTQIIKRLNR